MIDKMDAFGSLKHPRFFINFASQRTFVGDSFPDDGFEEVGVYDYFLYCGSSDASLLEQSDMSNPFNRKIGFSSLCREIPENIISLLIGDRSDYLLVPITSKVKIYHYSKEKEKLLSEGFSCNPFEEIDHSFAPGLYFFDFFPGVNRGWGKDENLLIGEYEGTWFRCVYDMNGGTHEFYSFIGYDFDRIVWRLPLEEDMINPKRVCTFSDRKYESLLQRVENIIRFGEGKFPSIGEDFLSYPWTYTNRDQKMYVVRWLRMYSDNFLTGELKRSFDNEIDLNDD